MEWFGSKIFALFQLFFFNLLGIFVTVSNKNPRLTQSRRDVSSHTDSTRRKKNEIIFPFWELLLSLSKIKTFESNS
ncbi:hypothetical protein Q767_15790 [Flavobacterium enshiense DK69]|uniref:Uncharacterized protein n=1 Tax=Flavobacterium enshiense DK69 TaxID=1107311 RepID=A0A0A2MUY2_9FLAO|nr:hypothetical protein Q767_15790 [Flavobacterium enshiense DK69]